MEQPLDFSFHKGNRLALADDLIQSPTPMPTPPPLLPPPQDKAHLLPSLHHPPPLDALEAQRTAAAAGGAAEEGEAKAATAQPKRRPRGKVPLERGFSQMNWLSLTRTQPDLAGLKGHSNKRLVSMEEVKQHQSEEDAWTVLRGRVYNVSPYLKFHPGGIDMLMQGAGNDCTALFTEYHPWVNAEFLLEKCLVGHLDVMG